jgi:hypothetical protein
VPVAGSGGDGGDGAGGKRPVFDARFNAEWAGLMEQFAAWLEPLSAWLAAAVPPLRSPGAPLSPDSKAAGGKGKGAAAGPPKHKASRRAQLPRRT